MVVSKPFTVPCPIRITPKRRGVINPSTDKDRVNRKLHLPNMETTNCTTDSNLVQHSNQRHRKNTAQDVSFDWSQVMTSLNLETSFNRSVLYLDQDHEAQGTALTRFPPLLSFAGSPRKVRRALFSGIDCYSDTINGGFCRRASWDCS